MEVQVRPPSCFSVCFVAVPNLTLKVAVPSPRGGVGATLKADFFEKKNEKKLEKWSRIGYLIQATFSQIRKASTQIQRSPFQIYI